MLKDIGEITWKQTIGAVFAFVGAVSPGFLILYLFKPELVESLDTIKLIIFSLSLSMPIFIANLFILSKLDADAEESDNYFVLAVVALFITFICSYPILLVTYLFALTFKEFLFGLAIAEIIMAIFVGVIATWGEKN